jgi:hypothetical protein
MRSKVVAVLLAVALGAVGYWIGARKGGGALAAPSCASTATLEYDPQARRITVFGNTVEPKVLAVDFGRLTGGEPDVCFDIRTADGSEPKFRKLRIDTTPPNGIGGGPVLVGDANFQGGKKRRAALRYAGSTPIWTKVPLGGQQVDGVRWAFRVEAELLDGSEIPYDPDLVIIKPRG